MATLMRLNEGCLQPAGGTSDLAAALAEPRTGILWLDMHDPSPGELQQLNDCIELHPLTLEDLQKGGQRPKYERFAGYDFMVMYSLAYSATSNARLQTREVGIVLTAKCMVTVHRGTIPEIDDLTARWQLATDSTKRDSLAYLVYNLADSLVDGYFPVLDGLEDRLDGIEERIYQGFDPSLLAEVFALRRDLLQLRKLVAPERDVFNLLLRDDSPVEDDTMRTYLTDVYDHLLRVLDMIDTYRDLVSGALDGFMSMQSNSLNQIMKVLTAASIILMSMALVTGVYGMNFVFMPELEWQFGYPFALALMAVIAGILALYFRRRNWL